jgi:hypothetical protein
MNNNLFSVNSSNEVYNSPMIGNGELTTTIGPSGFHNGYCPSEETSNRTVFWAGRRFKDARSGKIRIPRVSDEDLFGPTIPLLRNGRFFRHLQINGSTSSDSDWEQSLDIFKGFVYSRIRHPEGLLEENTSFICLNSNILVFRSLFTNNSASLIKIDFDIECQYGDAEGMMSAGSRLQIQKPHPSDKAFGNVEGLKSAGSEANDRPTHLLESLIIKYEVDEHLGEIHIGRFPESRIVTTSKGGRVMQKAELKPGQSTEFCYWAVYSDRWKYNHFIQYKSFEEILIPHLLAWENFWNTSSVITGHELLDSAYCSSLYTLRVNTSPWYTPPGYLSTHWEGRVFHDEFYPFMAYLSGGFWNLAERMPNYRLLIIPEAQRRSIGHGTFYAWEATENGVESAPYGHWVDEQFIHGQFAAEVWNLYLYTGNINKLRRYFPVIRGCVEWLIHDVIDQSGDMVKTRWLTDLSEGIYPVKNSIFVASAAIYTLEIASKAAKILKTELHQVEEWDRLAALLKKNLPVNTQDQTYNYSDNDNISIETSHLGPIFPFSFDIDSQLSMNTLHKALKAFHQQGIDQSDNKVLAWTWMWALSHLAITCFYKGETAAGSDTLLKVPQTMGPFMAPNEHIDRKYGPFLPWFTTGAGAFIYAVNSMFVQLYNTDGPILLQGWGKDFPECSFRRLPVGNNTYLSGDIKDGEIVSLLVQSVEDKEWHCLIPERLVKQLRFRPEACIGKANRKDFVELKIRISAGSLELIQSIN